MKNLTVLIFLALSFGMVQAQKKTETVNVPTRSKADFLYTVLRFEEAIPIGEVHSRSFMISPISVAGISLQSTALG